MALSKYIREKSTGKSYELTPGGYYKETSAPGEGSVEVGSVNDVYTQTAKEQTDPYYNQQSTSATAEGEKAAADAKTKLAALYSDRGMGNSSFYTGDVTNTGISMNRDLSNRLAGIENDRTNTFNQRYNQMNATQMAGNAEENRLLEAERERQRQIEADRKAEEDRQREIVRQAALDEQARIDAQAARDEAQRERDYNERVRIANEEEAAKVRAADAEARKTKTATGGTKTAAEKKAAVKTEAIGVAQQNLAAWVAAGKPAWYTERELIPSLVADFPELSEKEIASLVYAVRKNAKYGGE